MRLKPENRIDYSQLIILSFFSFILIIFPFLIVNTDAKYLSSWNSGNKNLNSSPFYFFSDELKDAEISSAEPMILFGVKNYKDDNNITAENINYDIKVLQGENEVSGLSISDIGNKILKGSEESENVIKITGFPEGDFKKEYTVKLISNSPYNQEITATYTVTHLDDLASIEVDKESMAPYVLVTLKTNDFEGTRNFKLSWNPDNEIIDNTDKKFDNADDNSVDIELFPNSSYVFRFINTSGNAQASDFKVEKA